MKLNNTRHGLTRDFVSLILSDMKNMEQQEDYIKSSVDYSSSEHQSIQNKINHLELVKTAMHQLNLMINDYCIEQIQVLRRTQEKETFTIDFLSTIDPREVIKKREAALLCERSESWLQKGDHKERFENQVNGGLNVLSFATYLKDLKPFEYQLFQKNYTKHIRSKVG